MIPSHIPDYFSQANDFEINSCQKSSRECSAATSALLCFLLQMLYDDEPGVEDVSCGLSLKKKTWFNGCFSHLVLAPVLYVVWGVEINI